MDFDHYFDNEALQAALQEWAEQFPGLIDLKTIGTSHEGKAIWLATVTNFSTGLDTDKPALWIDGNIHATELAGATTVLYILYQLLSRYGKEEEVTTLLDSSVLYAVPRINPDGAAAAMDRNPRFLRSGVRSYPWEETHEGLHQQDLDGDSRILQMRIADPAGDWKPSEATPRFLVKRGPGDFGGQYYRLLPEGLVEGYDGYQVRLAPPQAGLDFNRNFPFDWRPESDQFGAGPFPGSEPEIQAVVRFLAQHRNVTGALTFHTFSRVLLRPYSTRPDDQMNREDLEVFKTLGEIGSNITGYRAVSTFHDFTESPKDVTTGAFDDWVYDHLGAYVFTVELWDLPTVAGIKDRKFTDWFEKHPVEDDLQILKWVDEHVGPGGYVDWYPFDHPQLGREELGGWNTLYTWRNPPAAFVQKEAEPHLPFVLAIGRLLPHLHAPVCKARSVGENAWAIDLVVENTGYLPSYGSQQGRNREVVRPVTAEMQLPAGAKRIQGKQRIEIGHLEGRSNKTDRSSIWGYKGTDNRGLAQWVIEAPAGSVVHILVSSERAGKLRCTLTLETGS